MEYSNFENDSVAHNNVMSEFEKRKTLYDTVKNLNIFEDVDQGLTNCDCKSIDCIDCLYNKISTLKIYEKLNNVVECEKNVKKLKDKIDFMTRKQDDYVKCLNELENCIVDNPTLNFNKYNGDEIIIKINNKIKIVNESIEDQLVKKEKYSEELKKYNFLYKEFNYASIFKCIICVCDISDNKNLKIYNCGHYSCENCYVKLTTKKCSLCKEKITLFKLYI